MELKANELRIGNYLYTGGLVFKPYSKDGLYNIMKNIEDATDNIKPIPLTEEWLLKFRFRHVMNNWYNLHVNGNTFNVYIFEDRRYRIEIVSQSIGVFEFVHNLQNLYFALTNEELEIKM